MKAKLASNMAIFDQIADVKPGCRKHTVEKTYRGIHAGYRNDREMVPDTIFGKVRPQKLGKTPVRATFGRKWHRMTARIIRIRKAGIIN